MKKLLLAAGLSLTVACTPAFAQYADCSPKFLENLTLEFDESVNMIRADMLDLAKNHVETEMVYEIDQHELFKSNYVLYCTDIGKSNRIIYYMHGNLEDYEQNQQK